MPTLPQEEGPVPTLYQDKVHMPISFPEAALVPTLSHEEAPVSALYQEKVPWPTSSLEEALVTDGSLQGGN